MEQTKKSAPIIKTKSSDQKEVIISSAARDAYGYIGIADDHESSSIILSRTYYKPNNGIIVRNRDERGFFTNKGQFVHRTDAGKIIPELAKEFRYNSFVIKKYAEYDINLAEQIAEKHNNQLEDQCRTADGLPPRNRGPLDGARATFAKQAPSIREFLKNGPNFSIFYETGIYTAENHRQVYENHLLRTLNPAIKPQKVLPQEASENNDERIAAGD